MQRRPYSMRSCRARMCGYQMNPLEVGCAIKAGEVCGMPTGTGEGDEGCLLATAFIDDQHYLAGFPPTQTLAEGTFFPELIREYSY